MNCTHIKDLLPLYTEDDLPSQQADTVRAHLFSCPQCRESASEYEASQEWLRASGGSGGTQLEDRFFDDLRASVWRGIEESNKPRAFFNGWKWAIAFALLLITAGLVLYSRSMQPVRDIPDVVQLLPPPATGPVAAVTEPPPPKARRRPRQIRPLRMLPLLPAPVQAERTEVAHDGSDSMLRIEIQTADPNIKIIWLIPGPQRNGPSESDTE